ncbi:hypothetical protein [Paraburkholderia aspalathi]|uniref:hypothetical protein n=1 Tax=Paraburkholderia aspalathi TaxID=1324617 RepID=UPI0038B6D984
MLVQRTVDAWIPIRTGSQDEPPIRARSHLQTTKFLQALPAILPRIVPEVTHSVVDAEAPPPEILQYLSRNSRFIQSRLFQVIHISADVSYEDEGQAVEADNAEDEAMFQSAITAHYLSTAVRLAFQFSELASPGCIWAAEGVTVVGDQLTSEIEEKHFISELNGDDDFLGTWPSLIDIPIADVIDWVVASNMLASAFAETRIQRTFAAFTHVVGQSMSREGETLFRAMQGLEAFYCDGVGDLRRQLAEKVRLWLGPSAAKTNIVGHLYDLRSQYIHGSGKLQYWRGFRDAETEDAQTVERLSDGVAFAVRLLVASLQKCVTTHSTDIQWTFSGTTTTWKPG